MKKWAPAAVIVLASIVAFWPALSGSFIWDDDTVLTNNQLIRGPLHYIWFSKVPFDYFPMTYSTFWLEWRLWGLNPIGYHIVNLLLHSVSCVVLWRILKKLNIPAAWLGALLFAVHPVNVDSVAWIAERKNTLAMLFFMLSASSFVDFVQSGRRKSYFHSLAAFALSLLSKPAAACFPLVALGLVWLAPRLALSAKARYKPSTEPATTRHPLLQLAPFFVTAILLSAVTVWFQTNRAIAGDALPHRDLAARIVDAGWAFWAYLGKAIFPYPLSFVYPTWKINPHSLTAFAPAFGVVALFFLLWIARKSIGTMPIVAFAYFVLLLAPVLGFFDIYFQRYSLVADHWQYFALPAVTVLVAVVLSRFKLQYAVGIALAVLLCAITFSRCRVYQNDEILWLDTLRRNPDCWLACNNLGPRYYRIGRREDAVQLYQHSIAVNPKQAEIRNCLSEAFLDAGRPTEALEQLSIAASIDPNYPPTHANRGNIYQQLGKLPEAVAEFEEAIRLDPNYYQAYNNLGCVLSMLGKPNEARTNLQRALALHPDFPDAMGNLGSILNDMGQPSNALPLLQSAVASNPNNPAAHIALGNSLLALHRTAEAQREFLSAIQLDSSRYLAHYGLGNYFFTSGNTDDAQKEYERAIVLQPDHAESHYQLAVVLSAKHQRQAAVEHMREAVRLKPNWALALNNLAWTLASDRDCKFSDATQAVSLAQRAVDMSGGADPVMLDTLGVAWARSEVFSKAIDAARRAADIATRTGQSNLASDIGRRLALYNKRCIYSEP